MKINKMFYGPVIAIAVLAFAGTAFANQIHVNTAADGPGGNGEPTLYQIANGTAPGQNITPPLFTDLSSSSPQTNSANWRIGGTGTSTSVLEATYTSNFSNGTFGVYDPNNPLTRLDLLGGNSQFGVNPNRNTKGFLNYLGSGNFSAFTLDTTTGTQSNFQTANLGSNVFGFFLTIGGNTFYSDPTLNSGDKDRVVGYQGDKSGAALLNEYLFGWEDGTDNDYQDYVVAVESIRPVPEPSSIAMFGVGLLLIGFAARRIKKRATSEPIL